MESLKFDYHSTRAQKARIGNMLGKTRQPLFIMTAAVLALLGIGLLVIGMSLGWALIGFAAIPYSYHLWFENDLKHLKSPKDATDMDQLLSSDILGQLPENPSPQNIAAAVANVASGQFISVRFGISANMLNHLASPDPNDMPALWKEADDIRKKTGLERISASVLATAIIRLFPDYDKILAQVNLDDEDLYAGVRWHQHLRDLVDDYNKPKHTGGIARDWSFGYIPLLTRFGQNISSQIAAGGFLRVEIPSHLEAIDQLIDTFGTGGRQNAVLVGAPGSGKTTVINAFAAKLLDAKANIPGNLKFRQVFILDSSSLLAAAPGRGQLEDLIMSVLGEAYSAKNVIICLDNAQLFFEEGVGSVDLTNVLQPILEAGRLRIILSMDEQRFLQISQRNPAVSNSLNRINVIPASQAETLLVMQDHLLKLEFQRHVTYTYQSLKEAYRLSERYIFDLAMPGRAIKLLESAASYHENGLVTINSVQQAIEKTMNVKVSVASQTNDRERLLKMEELIHKRMINQTRAVGVVSDALRRARAGVRNQNRPIGTFLFLGPTGVGKTELAKALAEVYFEGEDQIIRMDLNEYVRSEDVSRLIADGADDPTSLTAQVMKQPFSVILLDEIEKAHPLVLTTFLQLLDEGVLRDIKNREVSFRDAIIIATSNAGADRIREYIDRGYELEQFEEQIVNELISSNQFRPEFLNRFDEIVIFRPLNKPELLQVIDLMLAGVNKTLALQKVSVVVDDDAKQLLVDRGYDPRLGARPMRRVVQRAVENVVAKQMLAGEASAGSEIRITLDQVQQILGSESSAAQIVSDNSSDNTVQ